MNVKALALTGATVGVAVVTLVGLNLVAPITHAVDQHVEHHAADSVFAASIAEPGAAAGADSRTMEVAQAEPTTEPTTEPAIEPAATHSEAHAASMPVDAASAGGQTALASGSCATAAVNRSLPPAPEVQPAAATVSQPAPVAPRREAAPVETPKPKSKAVAKKTVPVQPAETKLVWWPAATPGTLNLTYAGSASFTKAIALVFDGAHADGSKASDHIKVTTQEGQAVSGRWLVAQGNPRMLLYSVPPGVYRVSVDAGMSDKGDRTVATASSGLVYVQ